MRAFFYPAILSLALPVFGAPPTPSEPSTAWLGATDEWTDESNWSNGVPSASTSVLFNSKYTQNISTKGDIYVNDLIFGDGFALGDLGNYNIGVSKSLNVKGDLYYTNLRSA